MCLRYQPEAGLCFGLCYSLQACEAFHFGDIVCNFKLPGGYKKMGDDSMKKRVKEIIMDQLGLGEDEVKPESNFLDDLGADSLDIVELVMAMEEEFDMEIPDEEAEKIRTVKDVTDFILKHK